MAVVVVVVAVAVVVVVVVVIVVEVSLKRTITCYVFAIFVLSCVPLSVFDYVANMASEKL